MKFIYACFFIFSGVLSGGLLATATETAPVTQQLSLGNDLTNVEVFVFTDWLCPICKQIEPQFQTMAPKIMEVAKLHFVDIPVHDNSPAFIRFNAAFLINNKKDYLKTRSALNKLSDLTEKPTDEQMNELLKDKGIVFKPLEKNQVDEITKYFIGLAKEYKVKGTPTVIIVNNKTKEIKALRGPKEISEENILETIESLKKKN